MTTPSPRRRRSDKRRTDTQVEERNLKARDNRPTPDRPQAPTQDAGQPSSNYHNPTKRQSDDAGMTQPHDHKRPRGNPDTPMDDDTEDSSEQGSTDVDEDGNLINPPQTAGMVNDRKLPDLDETDRKILAFAILGIDVTEIFSPERVTQVCSKFGSKPGMAFDLQNGWDLSDPVKQAEVINIISKDKPTVVIGSPPCTLMSTLQTLNIHRYRHDAEWMARFNKELEKAKEHVRFCCRVYHMQLRGGRYFLHEHPWAARSWKINGIVELAEDPRVSVTKADQCMFGLKTSVAGKPGVQAPAKKSTGFMLNSGAIIQELDRRCDGKHDHAWLDRGRASKAAIYPRIVRCDLPRSQEAEGQRRIGEDPVLHHGGREEEQHCVQRSYEQRG